MRDGLVNAAIFTAVFLPGMVFLPMVTAVLVDRVRNQKIATAYRLILLIPAMIPGPLIFILWVWMYSNGIGPINYFLVDVLGVYDLTNQPTWLGSTNTTFLSLALMEWWWGLGFHTMFYLAGLSTIPKELYESARVDGASEWRIFWKITFARLRPILLVLVVLRFGTAYALIDEYILTGGFDRSKPTYTWTVYMWDTAFQVGDQNRGYAAAIGWIGTIGMLVGRALALLRLQEQGLTVATRVETETIAAHAPPAGAAPLAHPVGRDRQARHPAPPLPGDPLPDLLGVPALDQVAAGRVHEPHLAERLRFQLLPHGADRDRHAAAEHPEQRRFSRWRRC